MTSAITLCYHGKASSDDDGGAAMGALAITGGPPVRTRPYPRWPVWDGAERQGLIDVLESGDWWATEGTKVAAFEAAFGAFHGTAPAVACTNGTHAIELALSALGVGEGDEVIVPGWTFLATASAVLALGADPVLVDVDPTTGCIDPALVEAAVTGRTAAVVAVHLAGHPADLDTLTELSRRQQLALVEDCAHAHGSTWRGRPVATWGDAGTFSFQASKLMTAGEGGAMVSRQDDLLAAAKSFSDDGRRPGEWFHSHVVLGTNARMTEWQGAVLLAQLGRFPEQQHRRSTNARLLDERLRAIPGVHPQARDPRCTDQGHHGYLAFVDEAEFGASREAIRFALLEEGIPVAVAYPPVHRIEAFAGKDGLGPRRRGHPGFADVQLPVTDRLSGAALWFKTAVLMGSPDDALDVAVALAKIQRHARELGA